MTDTNINITQVQLRRGLDNEIIPAVLLAGEPAVTLDTGRMFFGMDSTIPFGPNGITPPARVEVLTEASLVTFARLFDRMDRTVGPVGLVESQITRRPYLIGTLAASTISNIVQVAVLDINSTVGAMSSTPADFLVCRGNTGAAIIDYFISDGTHVLRSGRLTILHNGNSTSDSAVLDDNYVSYSATASSGSSVVAVSAAFGADVLFSAERVPTGLTDHAIRLKYTNNTTSNLTISFRVASQGA